MRVGHGALADLLFGNEEIISEAEVGEWATSLASANNSTAVTLREPDSRLNTDSVDLNPWAVAARWEIGKQFSLSKGRGEELMAAMVAAMTQLTDALLQSAPQGTRPRVSSDLLSKADAVSYLHISPRTFERRVAPTLTAVRVGGRRFYKITEIDSWLADRKVGGSSATLARGSTSCASLSTGSDGLDPQASAILARLRSKPRGSTPTLSPGASATAALPSPKSPSTKRARRAGRPDEQ
jgi:hypothetical protein